MNWNELFKKRTPNTVKAELTVTGRPSEDHSKSIDFDQLVIALTRQSAKAQCTFLYKLVGALPLEVTHTLRKYVRDRLYGKDNVKRPVIGHPRRTSIGYGDGDGNIG